MGRFASKEKREKAATLLAQARLSRVAIAEAVGVNLSTLYRWEQDPEFRRRVDREIDEFRREQRRIGLATVEQRVAAKRHRHALLNRLISARADDPSMNGVPGGSTGLLVRRVKRVEMAGSGPDGPSSVEVAEFEYDAGPMKQLDALERDTAIELGQWQAKVDMSAVDIRQALATTQAASDAYADPDDGGDDGPDG